MPDPSRDDDTHVAFFATLRSMSGNQVLGLLGSVLADLVDGHTRGHVTLDRNEQAQVRSRYRKIADAIFEGRGDDAEQLTQRSMRYFLRKVQRDQPDVMDATVRWE